MRHRFTFFILAGLLITASLPISKGSAVNHLTRASLSIPSIHPDHFTLHLRLPQGSRVDFLRIYYYDTSPENSTAWLTAYDGGGSFQDLATVSTDGTVGYGTQLSSFLGHIVDNKTSAYVLNWQSKQPDSNMRLCGLRIAYRLPEGESWSTFRYFFASGSTMRPRSSSTRWAYDSAGCISAIQNNVYLPVIVGP